jgi:hypothetical protein
MNDDYKNKYLKYKSKYLLLKTQSGGTEIPVDLKPSFDNGNGDERVKRHLALYEWLNFKGTVGPNWDIMKKVYDENIVMKMSDGTKTVGLEESFEQMKGMYITAPDVRITQNKIQFGSGDWTAVLFVMEGTFTGPLKDPLHDKVYQPNGKKFKMDSCSLIKWNDQDKIIEENIFWDTRYWLQQLGIPQC